MQFPVKNEWSTPPAHPTSSRRGEEQLYLLVYTMYLTAVSINISLLKFKMKKRGNPEADS
jgi:hypothetical protein